LGVGVGGDDWDRGHRAIVVERHFEFSQETGQDDRRLGHRKRRADTHAGTCAERDVGRIGQEGVGLAGEAVRAKYRRVIPQLAVTVDDPGGDHNDRAGRNRYAADDIVADGQAGIERRGRIQPHGLEQHHPQTRPVLQVR